MEAATRRCCVRNKKESGVGAPKNPRQSHRRLLNWCQQTIRLQFSTKNGQRSWVKRGLHHLVDHGISHLRRRHRQRNATAKGSHNKRHPLTASAAQLGGLATVTHEGAVQVHHPKPGNVSLAMTLAGEVVMMTEAVLHHGVAATRHLAQRTLVAERLLRLAIMTLRVQTRQYHHDATAKAHWAYSTMNGAMIGAFRMVTDIVEVINQMVIADAGERIPTGSLLTIGMNVATMTEILMWDHRLALAHRLSHPVNQQSCGLRITWGGHSDCRTSPQKLISCALARSINVLQISCKRMNSMTKLAGSWLI